MSEEFLQYIWANSLFRSSECHTTQGEKIRILSVGELNRDAGPDFFNARVEAGGVVLAGNIEIHISSSDWFRHGHHKDRAYDNVILSVAEKADVDIYNSRGMAVRSIEIEYNKQFWPEYQFMQGVPQHPRCFRHLRKIDPNRVSVLMEAYGIRRLERKCEEVRQKLRLTHNDWESCFYQWLTRYWSGQVNADAFSYLAENLPYKTIIRCGDHLEHVEALLLGFSGLLPDNPEDEYVRSLRKEYDYLESKFRFKRMEASQWKFMRIRPIAFPTVRLALLAALLYRSDYLFSTLMDATSPEEVERLLDVSASSYWDTHYRFKHSSPFRIKKVGKSIKQIVMINAIIPFLFVYGKERAEEKYCEKALKWLDELPAENNHILSLWEEYGITFNSALQSQALLYVKSAYCDKHQCLSCGIGREVFRTIGN